MWIVENTSRLADKDRYEVVVRHMGHNGRIIAPLPNGFVPNTYMMNEKTLVVLGEDLMGSGLRTVKIDLTKSMKPFEPEENPLEASGWTFRAEDGHPRYNGLPPYWYVCSQCDFCVQMGSIMKDGRKAACEAIYHACANGKKDFATIHKPWRVVQDVARALIYVDKTPSTCKDCGAKAKLTKPDGFCSYCEWRLFDRTGNEINGSAIKDLKLPLKQEPQPVMSFSTPSWDDFA